MNKTKSYERILHRILNDGKQLPNIYRILGMPCKSVELINKLLNWYALLYVILFFYYF